MKLTFPATKHSLTPTKENGKVGFRLSYRRRYEPKPGQWVKAVSFLPARKLQKLMAKKELAIILLENIYDVEPEEIVDGVNVIWLRCTLPQTRDDKWAWEVSLEETGIGLL